MAWPRRIRFTQVQNHTFSPTLLRPGGCIVDLGANRGEFSRVLQARYGCTSILVEPNSDLIPHLETIRDARIVNCAVAAYGGVAMLYRSTNLEGSSLNRLPADQVVDAVPVQTIDLPGLVEALEISFIDLLKIDVEGAELEILASLKASLLRNVGQLTVEFHDWRGIPRVQILHAISRLEREGFSAVRFSIHTFGDVWFVNRARHRISGPHITYLRHVVRYQRALKRFLNRTLEAPRQRKLA